MGKELLIDLFNELSKIERLQGNTVVNTLRKYCMKIDFSSRELCFEDIYKLLEDGDAQIVNQNLMKSVNNHHKSMSKSDFRILRILWSNIKCYTSAENGLPYGIDFTKNDTPNSCIIYGTNGIGKSAIFGALEYTFCKFVSEYELRQQEKEPDWLAFLAHNSNRDDIFCQSETVSGKFLHTDSPIEEAKRFLANNCFINETRVNNNGKVNYSTDGDYSAHKLIAEGLGLKDIFDVMIVFSRMSLYNRQKEKKEYLSANLAITQSRNLLDQWNSKKNDTKKAIEELKNGHEISQSDVNSVRINEILKQVQSSKIVFEVDENKLESNMRDFMVNYQQWNDLDNSVIIEHQYQMMHHAKLLINSIGEVVSCPLCNGQIGRAELLGHITHEQMIIAERYALKMRSEQIMERFFETLDAVINQCNDFISIGNGVVVKLSEFSALEKLMNQTKHIVNQMVSFRDSDYICTLLTIRNSGDRMYQLNRFLYFELEKVISRVRTLEECIKDNINELFVNIETSINSLASTENVDKMRQLGILEREMDYISTQIENEEMYLSNLYKISKQTKQKYDLQVDIINNAKLIEPYIRSIVGRKIVEQFMPIKSTIEQMMEGFLNDDNVSINIDFKNDFISVNILTPEGAMVSPAVYFNTFRYRLFCTSLSLSLVLLMRQRLGVNLPIVFDDPFLGFDSTQRDYMTKFCQNITEIVGKFNTLQMPIQIVVFTHNWQLFQILKTALQPVKSVQFMILDGDKNAQKSNNYYNIARKV